MNVLILSAGPNDAASDDGYPLCLTEFDSIPLIQLIINSCSVLKPASITIAFNKEQVRKYRLDSIVSLLWPGSQCVRIEGPTQGAACTALLAVKRIDNEDELLVLNANELLDVDFLKVVEEFRDRKYDAGVIIFSSVHPRYSFVRLDKQKLVVEAAEKNPISKHATAGFYWFAKGTAFVSAAKQHIRKDARVNGLFYICPTLNELILERRRIGVYEIDGSAYQPLKTERQTLRARESEARARSPR